MRRKRVLKPIQSIEEVQASIDTYRDRIAGRLDGRHASPPAVPGELTGDGAGAAPFSYRDVFDDLGTDLESLRQGVIAAEDEHVRRLIRAAELRRRNRELGSELYDQQVRARQVIGAASDRERTFELTAVLGKTPQNLKPLEEQSDQTVKLLREPAVAQTSVVLFGVEITFGAVADGLGGSLVRFRSSRRDYLRVRKAVGESQVLLDRAIDEFRGRFPWIAQALESFARMAGERELADRIRTSIRRVTRRQGEDEEPADDASAGEPLADEVSADEMTPEQASSEETASLTETVSASSTETTPAAAGS